jgi:hypothetical protein
MFRLTGKSERKIKKLKVGLRHGSCELQPLNPPVSGVILIYFLRISPTDKQKSRHGFRGGTDET